MIAERMVGKSLGKGVFDITREVKEAEAEYGKENVINSTIGTFYGEDENLAVLDTVEKIYKNLPAAELFGYAPGISGSKEYKEAVKENVFDIYKSSFDKSFIGVTATPGGTGAIHNTLKAYMDCSETVLLPEFMWEAYKHLAAANGLKFDTYSLFDGDGFNLSSFSEKVLKMVKKQHKVLAVINDPCQNPTGYSLSLEEWKAVVEILKEAAKYGEVILLDDIAYLDYDFRGAAKSREYMTLFNGLPENILVIIAASMSKSFTSYGLRVGAQVAVSSSQKVIEEFDTASTFLCRTSWSNTTRGGMKLLAEIYGNEKLLKEVEDEREEKIILLEKRAEIFLREAEKEGLITCPFRSGFFITIPLKENAAEIIADLKSKKVFVLPVLGGMRIALCSVSCNKIEKLPKILAESIKKFNK